MLIFTLYCTIIFIHLAALGIPLSLYLASIVEPNKKIGIYIMTPVFGLAFQLYFGTLIHSLFGLKPITVFLCIIVIAIVVLILIINLNNVKEYKKELFNTKKGFGISIIVGIIALLINSMDLYQVPFNEYLPVTNADTFNYFGHIDQFRIVGENTPIINYPAGFQPRIEHAIGARDAVVAFSAAVAEVLKIETHTAFFISLRVVLMLLSVGVFSTLIFLTSSYKAAFFGLFFSIFGNFYLHQILQQFSSSSIGSTMVSAVLFTFSVYANNKIINHSQSWSIIPGLISGILLMTSPETGVVVLSVIAVWYVVDHLDRNFSRILYSARNLIAGILLGSLPVLHLIVLFVYGQIIGSVSGHPGDWIANSAILFQASGLGFIKTNGLNSLPITIIVCILITSAFYIISLIIIIKKIIKKKLNNNILMPIIIFSLVSLSIATVAFFLGKGYVLLKILDYFSIIPPIIFGISILHIFEFEIDYPFRNISIAFCSFFILFYGVIALKEKYEILNSYRKEVLGIPKLSLFKLKNILNIHTPVIPDLEGNSLLLFLYVNRFNTIKFAFDGEPVTKYRYIPNIYPTIGMPLARISLPGYRDKIITDITHKTPWQNKPYLLDYDGVLKIVDSNWLPPEGEHEETIFRWVSNKGLFKLLITEPDISRKLHLKINPGPDLTSENQILLIINQKIMLNINPNDLPISLDILLNKLEFGENIGEIFILGPKNGIRQISISEFKLN